MKNWFLERFLPMWAKNTVRKDLERAEAKAAALEQENRELRAYIKGLKYAARYRYCLPRGSGLPRAQAPSQ